MFLLSLDISFIFYVPRLLILGLHQRIYTFKKCTFFSFCSSLLSSAAIATVCYFPINIIFFLFFGCLVFSAFPLPSFSLKHNLFCPSFSPSKHCFVIIFYYCTYMCQHLLFHTRPQSTPPVYIFIPLLLSIPLFFILCLVPPSAVIQPQYEPE